MHLTHRPLELTYRHVFRISRGAAATTRNVLVELAHEGLVGRGEAVPFRYLGWPEEAVSASLEALRAPLADADPTTVGSLAAELGALPGVAHPALAAVVAALWDLHGQALGQPVWRLLGLDPARAGLTSFTLSLGSAGEVLAQADDAAPYPILKVKCGGPDDLGVVAALAAHTGKRLWVDANGGWRPDEAARLAGALAALGVELIEQPVPAGAGDAEGLARVRAASPLPIVADESVRSPADVARLAGAVDGVNVKLEKVGGLSAALTTIAAARAGGLRVMLGCFGSSSVAMSAAAQLAPLADWCDLDGHLLLRDDPFIGMTAPGGAITLPSGPGLGVTPRAG
jgi:L-alanine-DL-glutamate epimerase-like enolase superfamily enzyme